MNIFRYVIVNTFLTFTVVTHMLERVIHMLVSDARTCLISFGGTKNVTMFYRYEATFEAFYMRYHILSQHKPHVTFTQ
jgi:hypothetical protein